MIRKIYFILFFIIISLGTYSCYKESKLLVKSEFQVTVIDDNHTAPVKIKFDNNSTGADFYQWTFEGGEPASSTEKEPQGVIYSKAGTYTVKLDVWNDYERDTKEFTFSVDSTVSIGFDTDILINDFAPAKVRITNNTTGASSFMWTFDGGIPATSTQQYPEDVLFNTEGDHKITLVVSNGRESFTTSKVISLKPALSVDFDIVPSFDDFDYEAPFDADLVNKTISGITYKWTCLGATVSNETARDAKLKIQTPGTYKILLEVNNGQETKQLEKEIVVKPNTNLYTMKDVKFGIKSAVSTLGSFYSLSQRRVIPDTEISATNGKDIDLVFFGINSTFEKCYFTSPDNALNVGFYPIPNAPLTYFVNTLETSILSLSDNQFETMINDSQLAAMDIKSVSNTTSWFIAIPVPRIILFETADGKKGAIKVKAFVSEQKQSYVLADIKFQKEAR